MRHSATKITSIVFCAAQRAKIPNDTASEFRSKENYEYDYVNNLLKYYDTITVTYYPNSGVIIDLSSEN